MRGKIVIDLHESDRDQAVEPGVGDFLGDIAIGQGIIRILLFLLNELHETAALADSFSADLIRLRRADIIELR